jgi:hypothetical protein
MERGISIGWLRAAGALTAAAGISCGPGIHSGDGWYFVSKPIDRSGDQLVLREGVLDVWENCVAESSLITLRRFDRIDHTGAIGPVFSVEVSSSNTFVNDPQISIVSPAAVDPAQGLTIGYLVPGDPDKQWVPDSPATPPTCAAGVVCGPVQIESFKQPGGDPTKATTTVEFAIVKQCATSRGDCPSRQACNSGACQQCPIPTGGDCNP